MKIEFKCNPELEARDAELFTPIYTTAHHFLGNAAIKDLDNSVINIYVQQTKNITMLTLQEYLMHILNDLWEKNIKAHLKIIKETLQQRSSDHKFITEKNIAHTLRSLNFEIKDRDKIGYYVTYNPDLLKTWGERYLTHISQDTTPPTPRAQETRKEGDHDVEDLHPKHIHKDKEMSQSNEEAIRELEKQIQVQAEEVRNKGNMLKIRELHKLLRKYKELGGKCTYNGDEWKLVH